MADKTDATAPCHWVAIDVARYWNAVLIETASGQRHRFRMANAAEDFDRLIEFLNGLGGRVRAALGPTGDYHRAIAHRLVSLNAHATQADNRRYDIDAAAPVIVDNSALLPLIYEDGI